MRKSLSLPSVSFFVVALAVQAHAGHFSSPRGFSFDYPDGWVVGTKEVQQALFEQYQPVFEKMGRVDFDKTAVMIFDPQNDEFIENLNVVISAGRMPVNEDSCRKMTQMLPEQLKSAGFNPTDVRAEIVTFGNRKAISTRWTIAGLVPGVALRQWQIALPGRNQTYVVTASATTASFPGYEARFRDIFASFRADGGTFGFWYSLPGVVQYAIIGGIAGGILGALAPLWRRKARAAPDNKTT